MIIGNVPYLVFCNIVSALFIPLGIGSRGQRGRRPQLCRHNGRDCASRHRAGWRHLICNTTANCGHHGLCSGMLQHLGKLLFVRKLIFLWFGNEQFKISTWMQQVIPWKWLSQCAECEGFQNNSGCGYKWNIMIRYYLSLSARAGQQNIAQGPGTLTRL